MLDHLNNTGAMDVPCPSATLRSVPLASPVNKIADIGFPSPKLCLPSQLMKKVSTPVIKNLYPW